MYLHVKVMAGAKKELIEQTGESSFSVSVKVPAKRNLANRRVTELLAGYLQVPVKKIRLINGHISPSKLFSIVEE